MQRVLFLGSPSFAVPALHALHSQKNVEILAVFTQPPRPAGRGQKLEKTPVHTAAEALGLPVFTPEKLKGDALTHILSFPADVLCVVGYGLLLPKQLVEERLCLNVHPSALPRWRGATPVQSAILAGDTSTQVCIMRLEAGMDTGPVYTRTPVPIGPTTTASELNDIVWLLGAQQLVYVLQNLATLTPIPQQGEPTHAPKITPAMKVLDFSKSAQELHNQVRAIGGTATLLGEPLKVAETLPLTNTHTTAPGTILTTVPLTVACGGGTTLMLGSLQRAGKKMMSASETLRGWPALTAGVTFEKPIPFAS